VFYISIGFLLDDMNGVWCCRSKVGLMRELTAYVLPVHYHRV
jgi:hypothetical protein